MAQKREKEVGSTRHICILLIRVASLLTAYAKETASLNTTQTSTPPPAPLKDSTAYLHSFYLNNRIPSPNPQAHNSHNPHCPRHTPQSRPPRVVLQHHIRVVVHGPRDQIHPRQLVDPLQGHSCNISGGDTRCVQAERLKAVCSGGFGARDAAESGLGKGGVLGTVGFCAAGAVFPSVWKYLG